MSTTDKNINYTAADFQRYYNGSMPAAEMHALEKAALEDPFLADALDGYQFTQTAEDDIRELAAQIPPKEEEKKKGAVISMHTWMRVAAVLVLISGLTFITYKINHRKPEQVVAKNDNPPAAKEQAFISPKNENADSTQLAMVEQLKTANYKSTENKTLQSQGSIATNRATFYTITQSDSKFFSSDTDEKKTAEPGIDDYFAKKDLAEKAAAPAKTPVSLTSSAERYLLQGKITDALGEPVPFANISTTQNKPIAVTDANGNFSFKANDSMMYANISAAGYSSVNQNLASNNSRQFIVLPQNAQAMEEVVVTGLAKPRKKESVGVSSAKVTSTDLGINGRVSGLQIQAEPVVGTQSFNKYITDSARVATWARLRADKAVRDSVVLSFKVNNEGEPVKIKTEKSSCGDCKTEAIRLLRAGPRWKPSQGSRVQTTIKF